MAATYGPCPIKRKRRTKKEIERLRRALFDIVEEDQPTSARHTYYGMVTRGFIPKSEVDYRNVVIRLLGNMREDGDLPFEWITDSTRWRIKPRTWSSLDAMLRYSQQTYRRAVWDSHPDHIEVWCESDSVAGVLQESTWTWDIGLHVCRGQSPKRFVWDSAQDFKRIDKNIFVYYFGDYDPSGLNIGASVEKRLRRYSENRDFHFERVAVQDWQIDEFHLPTRPPKEDDKQNKRHGLTRTVEIEALPVAELRAMCSDKLQAHVTSDHLERIEKVEAAERDTLETIVAGLGPAA